MSDIMKIQDSPGWVKNMTTNAILNSDLEALKQHKLLKQRNLDFNIMKQEIEQLKQNVDNIQDNLSDIKDLLIQVVKNK